MHDRDGEIALLSLPSYEQFAFRAGERFCYEYTFHVPWRHEIRVE
jgi:hypothetical protein